MATKSNTDSKKPGPDPERLIITEDPEEALRRLLRVPDDDGEAEPPTGPEETAD